MVNTESKRNRFFSKLLPPKEKSPKPQSGKYISWEFIIDSEGKYLNISPEVTECLGYQVADFIDQSIFSFLMMDESSEKLQMLFSNQELPIDIDLFFQSKFGNFIPCNLKLTRFSEEYQSRPTFIGITQTLEILSTPELEKRSKKITYPQKFSDLALSPSQDSTSNQNIPETNEEINLPISIDHNYSPANIELIQPYTNEVNHLIEPIDIYKLTYKVINQFISNKNLIIGVFQRGENILQFPIVKTDSDIRYYPENNDFEPLINFIVKGKQKLYLPEQIPPQIKNSNEARIRNFPKSLLGVPIQIGERILGAIILYDIDFENKFSETELEYLSIISSKMAIALENAFIFQEMNYALSAIELREKYQNQITQAVKILSKSGSQNLEKVLELVGKASNIDRVFFAKSNLEEGIQSWEIQVCWQSDEKFNPIHLSNEILFEVFNEYQSAIIERGYFQVNFENLDRAIDTWLNMRGTNSILVLSVKNKFEFPDIIVFEDLHQNHYWNVEEIRFLELVSETLSGILIHESEINRLNIQLLESESINFVKDCLHNARTLNEILEVIMKYIFSLEISDSALYLFGDADNNQPDHFEIAAYWSNESIQTEPFPPNTFDRFIVNNLFHQEFPTYYSQIKNTNLSSKTLQILAKQNISSLGIIPLKSTNHNFGSIILFSQIHHEFSNEEQILVGELLETITKCVKNFIYYHLEQNYKIENQFFKKVNSIIKSQNLMDITSYISEYLHEESEAIFSIFLLESKENPKVSDYYEIKKEFSKNEISPLYDAWKSQEFNELLNKLITQNLDGVIDVKSLKTDSTTIQELLDFEVQSALVLPIQTQTSTIGYLIVLANQSQAIKNDKITNLKYLINEISILLIAHSKRDNFIELDNKINIAASIVHDTSSILTIDQLMIAISKQIQEKFGFLAVSIHVCNNEDNILDKVANSYGGTDRDPTTLSKCENSYLLVSDVFEKGQPVILSDLEYKEWNTDNSNSPSIRSQLILPLKMSDRMIGVLDIQSQRKNEFESKNLRYFQLLADQIATEIQNAQLYEKSKNMANDISEIDRIKSQFLANMSHEFRTPLNSIIGFSKVIMTGIDGPINETQQQDLNAIHNAGQYLLRLVNDILDITKIEAGSMKLNMVKTNIPNLISSILPAAQNLIKEKVIKIEVNHQENLPEILVDRNRISQVIMNIISNAAKFTDYGKITISTSIEKVNNTNHEILITINDTGIGINKVDQDRLFKPFEQSNTTDKNRSFGSGLGLTISKSLVQLHHGRIGLLQSKPGEGSTFFIALPVQ